MLRTRRKPRAPREPGFVAYLCGHASELTHDPEDEEVIDDLEQDQMLHGDDTMTDVEADADALASAGFGTDEDYGGGCGCLGDE